MHLICHHTHAKKYIYKYKQTASVSNGPSVVTLTPSSGHGFAAAAVAAAGHQPQLTTTPSATGTTATARPIQVSFDILNQEMSSIPAATSIGGHHTRDISKKRAAENDMFQLVPTHDAFLFFTLL